MTKFEKPETITDEDIGKEIKTELLNPSGQPFFRKKDKEILAITLTTVTHPENEKAGLLIKDYWEKIGVKVKLDLVDTAKIQKETIKKRKYEALLYGQNIGFDPDPYPFWHSSQIDDPGLNLALFSDKKADKLIIDARSSHDPAARAKSYQEFQKILQDSIPAIFLYSPSYTYILSQQIRGFNIQSIIEPADRFNNLNEWHTKTKRTWRNWQTR